MSRWNSGSCGLWITPSGWNSYPTANGLADMIVDQIRYAISTNDSDDVIVDPVSVYIIT